MRTLSSSFNDQPTRPERQGTPGQPSPVEIPAGEAPEDDGYLDYLWSELNAAPKPEEPRTEVKIQAPDGATPDDYSAALKALRFEFSKNLQTGRIYLNGEPFSDGLEAKVMVALRNAGFRNKEVFREVYEALALDNGFHPIKDVLNGLVWDGHDHIGKLAEYFEDKDGTFKQLIRAWAIGAVRKVMFQDKYGMEQNPMLVLEGAQGIGKSTFCAWLASPFEGQYIKAEIRPDDKDSLIDATQKLVWEVEELTSTTTRQDVNALKAFLTKQFATFRVPYGRHPVDMPITASFIGTFNDDGNGYLIDTTGNRRLQTCELLTINHKYLTEVNAAQVWAQAYAAAKSGETQKLDPETLAIVNEVNSRYMVEDQLEYFISEMYEVKPSHEDWFMPYTEISEALQRAEVVKNPAERQYSNRMKAIFKQKGATKGLRRVGGVPRKGYIGVRVRPEQP